MDGEAPRSTEICSTSPTSISSVTPSSLLCAVSWTVAGSLDRSVPTIALVANTRCAAAGRSRPALVRAAWFVPSRAQSSCAREGWKSRRTHRARAVCVPRSSIAGPSRPSSRAVAMERRRSSGGSTPPPRRGGARSAHRPAQRWKRSGHFAPLSWIHRPASVRRGRLMYVDGDDGISVESRSASLTGDR